MRLLSIAILTLLMFLPTACYEFNNPVDPAAADYRGDSAAPPAAQYRRAITLDNGGSILSDYQVRVTLNTALMGTPYQNITASGSDIRFQDAGGTPLSFWIEEWNSAGDSLIWVKVGSIPVGLSTIYLYYGDPAASSSSSGIATFLFFDDFEDHAAGEVADGWTGTTGTYQVVDDSGRMVLDDGVGVGEAVVSAHINMQSHSVRERVRSVDGVIDMAGLIMWYSSDANFMCAGAATSSVGRVFRNNSTVWEQRGTDWLISPAVDTNWHTLELSVAVTSMTVSIDDIPIGTTITGFGSSGGRTGFWSQDSGNRTYHDFHLVRKYVATEPVVTVGPEQAL